MNAARRRLTIRPGKWWAFWKPTGGSGTGAVYSEMKPEGDHHAEEDADSDCHADEYTNEDERADPHPHAALDTATQAVPCLKNQDGDGEPEADTAVRPPLLGGQTSAMTPSFSTEDERADPHPHAALDTATQAVPC
jgi:hypothetical protein